MKTDIERKIENIVQKENILSESEVSHLLVLVRKHLERTRDSEFSVLKFFCDWSMHIEINRSLPALEILRKLNAVINELKRTPDNKQLIDRITEVISFQVLKQELTAFFGSIGIQDELFFNKWRSFVQTYTNIVLDCPLVLPSSPRNKRQKLIIKEIVENPIKEGAWVIGFYLTTLRNSFFLGGIKPIKGKSLCLVLATKDTTRIVVPLSKVYLS